ncbi:MAG: hypothetical protein Q9197_003537 [Variospora fuerteventurae]
MTEPIPPQSEVRCPTCFIEFSFPGARELHWKTSSCRFKCTLCPERTNHGSDQGLRDHWKDKHARLYCSACDKVCVNRRALRDHQCIRQTHCDTCRVVFPSDEAQKCHFRTHHIFIRYCDGCRKMYQDQDDGRKCHKKHCYTGKHDPESKTRGDAEMKEEDSDVDKAARSEEKQRRSRRDPNSNREDTKSGANEHPHNSKRRDQKRNRTEDTKGNQRSDWESNEKARSPKELLRKGFPDLYSCLGLSVWSPQEEVVQAARRKRIEVHPDRVKKADMTDDDLQRVDEIAKEVGQAADILSDPVKRVKYDADLRQQRVRR